MRRRGRHAGSGPGSGEDVRELLTAEHLVRSTLTTVLPDVDDGEEHPWEWLRDLAAEAGVDVTLEEIANPGDAARAATYDRRMLPPEWIEHRRTGDRELLGWVRPDGEGFVAIDRLGHEVTGVVDWHDAETALDERGLAWLADLWQLVHDDGTATRVRIVEVSPERVVVKLDDFGAVGAELRSWTLPFPAPARLRPYVGDAHVIDGLPGGR